MGGSKGGGGGSKSRCCCEKKETNGARGGGRLRKRLVHNSGDDIIKTPEKRSIINVGTTATINTTTTCVSVPCVPQCHDSISNQAAIEHVHKRSLAATLKQLKCYTFSLREGRMTYTSPQFGVSFVSDSGDCTSPPIRSASWPKGECAV